VIHRPNYLHHQAEAKRVLSTKLNRGT